MKEFIDGAGKTDGPKMFTLTEPNQELTFPLAIYGHCDFVNWDNGASSNYAFAETQLIGKKRFYLRLNPQNQAKS